jgi:hypothetical protein
MNARRASRTRTIRSADDDEPVVAHGARHPGRRDLCAAPRGRRWLRPSSNVSSARRIVAVSLTREDTVRLLPGSSAFTLVDAASAGIPREASLLHGTEIVVEGGQRPLDTLGVAGAAVPNLREITSDTGEITWSSASRTMIVDTPKTKVVAGYCIGRSHPCDRLRDFVQYRTGVSALSVKKTGRISASGRGRYLLFLDGQRADYYGRNRGGASAPVSGGKGEGILP